MTLRVNAIQDGKVEVVLLNDRTTVALFFLLDFQHGRVHTLLNDGGLCYKYNEPDVADARAHATFFYRVLGNRIAELICVDVEPIDCEIVIPVNMFLRSADDAIEEAVEHFRREGAG